MTLIDDFDGISDAQTLRDYNANWDISLGDVADGVGLSSGFTGATFNADWIYRWTGAGGNPGNDQWAAVTIIDASGWVGPSVRSSAGGNGYSLIVSDLVQTLAEWVSGTWNGLATYVSAVSSGDKWALEVVGTALRVWKDTGGGWTLVGSVTDASHASGNIGVCGYSNGTGAGDNFEGGGAMFPIAGTTSLTLTPSGTLGGSGALAGAAALTLTPAGTLGGVGTLAGTAALSLSAAGDLTDAGGGGGGGAPGAGIGVALSIRL